MGNKTLDKDFQNLSEKWVDHKSIKIRLKHNQKFYGKKMESVKCLNHVLDK